MSDQNSKTRNNFVATTEIGTRAIDRVSRGSINILTDPGPILVRQSRILVEYGPPRHGKTVGRFPLSLLAPRMT